MNRRSFVKTAVSAFAAAPLVSRISRSASAASKFDPGFATAGQAARAIRGGVISARELTEHTYRRISQHNPKVNAGSGRGPRRRKSVGAAARAADRHQG
jgi:hypothetical protein